MKKLDFKTQLYLVEHCNLRNFARVMYRDILRNLDNVINLVNSKVRYKVEPLGIKRIEEVYRKFKKWNVL